MRKNTDIEEESTEQKKKGAETVDLEKKKQSKYLSRIKNTHYLYLQKREKIKLNEREKKQRCRETIKKNEQEKDDANETKVGEELGKDEVVERARV